MERYNEYKDSGELWLGEIPSHWGVKRLKACFTERNERYSRNESLGILSVMKGIGVIPYEDKGNVGNNAKEDKTQYKVARKGDLVINSMNVIIGSLGITPKDGYISPAYYAFSPRTGIDERYYSYVLSLNSAQKNIRRFSKGIMEIRLKISSSDFLSIPFPVPPTAEQQAIAKYLDTSTARIDEAIAQQQKMIDLLNERKQIIINNAVTKGLNPSAPMKDSGVDWIGEIPEHWEIKKLKHVCQAFGRIGFRGYSTTDLVDEGEGCITLSPSNMRDGQMQYEKCTYLSWEKYEESPEIKIFNGDILFVKTGSTYGKSSLVDNLPLEATINPQLLVFKNFTCNNRFLAHVLQTTTIKTQVEVSVIGGTIPTISQQKILNYVFPYPTEDEQEAIVAYIENKSTPINAAIKASERQISLLQERKQIIINDVVTGKVKVS